MNRRKFIKTGVLFVPTYMAGKELVAQPAYVREMLNPQPPKLAAIGCTLYASNTGSIGNNTTNFSILSQKVLCSTNLSVCKVLIYQHSAEGTGNIFIRVRSAANNGGTLHGTSDVLANNATGWRTFNFTTPAAVTTDFFLTVITSAGAGYCAVRSGGTGNAYSDTSADMFNGSTDMNEDMAFECWTQPT